MKWPLVDLNTPFAQSSGIVSDMDYSNEDSIHIHDGHDIDITMTPDADSTSLVIDDNAENKGQVVESDSTHFPAEVRPFPMITSRRRGFISMTAAMTRRQRSMVSTGLKRIVSNTARCLRARSRSESLM